MNYIEKALESAEMLTVPEFIKHVNYPIDTFMIDRFWATLESNKLIYVDDELISWMGYIGAEQKARKMAFVRLLKDKEYFHYTNDEYENFLATVDNKYNDLYPRVDRGNGKGRTKHLLLTSDTLKTTMMKLSTNRGDRIRDYYVRLENLIILYIKYQAVYKERTLQDEIKNLREICRNFTRECSITESDNAIYRQIGCVYFCECPALSRVKIGYTYNLETRLREIQTGCPDKIRLIRTINTDRPEGLEAELHAKFDNKRVIGEWFEISSEEINEISVD